MNESTGMLVADDYCGLPLMEADAAPADEDEAHAASRRARIAAAAYLLAEARAFAPGRELDDWLQAEREIDRGSDQTRR
jgi:hypothetical protein